MEIKFLTAGGLKTCYAEFGDKTKPTIIALSGLGGSKLAFIELAMQLREDYHFIGVDLPGHSLTASYKTMTDYSVENLTAWLEDFVAKLNKDNFFLLGHSFGAWLALHYASRYPHRVQKIMLIDGAYHNTRKMKEYFATVDKTDLNFPVSLSLDEEILEAINYHDNFVFESMEEYLASEKEASSRHSELIKISDVDRVKQVDGKIKLAVDKNVSIAVFINMDKYPADEIYDELKMPILLLVAGLPADKHFQNLKEIFIADFEKRTNGTAKTILASHHIYIDDPLRVEQEIREFMQ